MPSFPPAPDKLAITNHERINSLLSLYIPVSGCVSPDTSRGVFDGESLRIIAVPDQGKHVTQRLDGDHLIGGRVTLNDARL